MNPLLIKFPSRSRPKIFADTFAKWNARPVDVRFIVSLDEDDETLPGYMEFLAKQPNAKAFVGRSSCKVEAINRDVEHADWMWDTLVCAADDMIPQRDDYAAEIARLMEAHWPDTDGVLHFNDGRNARVLNTLPVVGRAYYERTRAIYSSDYLSVWCDNEMQAVSERLGRVVYVDEVLVRHAWIEVTGRDPLHRRNEASQLYQADQATFERRRLAGFPS